MEKFSRLNPSVISEGDELISKSSFDQMIKSGEYEAFTAEALQRFVKDCNDVIKKGQSVGIDEEEEAGLNKAMGDFRSLTKVTVLDRNGDKVPVYMRKKDEAKQE